MTSATVDTNRTRAIDDAPTQSERAAATTIRVEHLSVRLELQRERVTSLREEAIRLLQRRPVETDEFWPVRDVSFSVARGEAFGVVGRNGAGKSTLLKVIAGVLAPTRGRVEVRGRIAPLLELGAGFDAELTGRENVFLYGSLLGFSRRRLEERFDRIVAFAELEEFIDVPLKNYSSGMATRLGFAVASDVDADILIVDEALTVGDARFQLKCMERIERFIKDGVTILLVSHSPEHIQRLCRKAIWIEHGEVVQHGPAEDVLAAYAAGEYEAPKVHARATIPDAGEPPVETSAPTTLLDVTAGMYDFVDLSPDVTYTLPALSRLYAAEGLGITGDPVAAKRLDDMGFHGTVCPVADVDLPENAVRFVSVVGLLHFMPGVEPLEALVARTTHWARDFVLLRFPSYEDEAMLRAHGLKFYWHDWSNAWVRPRVDQILGMLHALGHDQTTVRYRFPALSSDSTSLLPLGAPPEQQQYDPLVHGVKPTVVFDRPVYQHIEVFVALRAFDPTEWSGIVRAAEAL